MILGYRDSRDKLHLYSTGTSGLVEMKTKFVPGEIHFGLLRVEGRLLLWTYLPEDSVSGVRRGEWFLLLRRRGGRRRWRDASAGVAHVRAAVQHAPSCILELWPQPSA